MILEIQKKERFSLLLKYKPSNYPTVNECIIKRKIDEDLILSSLNLWEPYPYSNFSWHKGAPTEQTSQSYGWSDPVLPSYWIQSAQHLMCAEEPSQTRPLPRGVPPIARLRPHHLILPTMRNPNHRPHPPAQPPSTQTRINTALARDSLSVSEDHLVRR